MRTVVFLNARSRQARKMADRVAAELPIKLPKHTIIDTIIVREFKDFKPALEKLKKHARMQCLIVGSGDGTINTILGSLQKQHRLIYGLLPLGTSNTFVRSLGIKPTYEAALAVIQKGRTDKVSLGKVNGHTFANIAGIGLPVKVSGEVSDTTKRFLGPFAYIVSGLRSLTSHEAFECEVHTDKEKISFTTHHLLIANGPIHGNIPLSKNLSVRDNKLMLVSFGTDNSRLRYAKSIIRFGLQNHYQDPDTRLYPVRQATITTGPVRKVEIDGEVVTQTPATFTVQKNAIKVFTPRKRWLRK